MNDADAAYGMFTANRDPNLPIAPIGMGGQMQKQSASFAKGKYYVEIVALPPTRDRRNRCTETFAQRSSTAWKAGPRLPETLSGFPRKTSLLPA